MSRKVGLTGQSRKRVCPCGCGHHVMGRKSKKFYSPACRVKTHRGGPSRADAKAPSVAEKALQDSGALAQDGGVTLTDTNAPEVHCPCGRLMPKLEGPLSVVAYCFDCVQDHRCPCYNRPAWQGRK